MKIALLLFLFLITAILLINSLFWGFWSDFENVGQDVDFYSTYTKALCFGTTCRDFEIKCLDENVLEMKPISGFVTFSEEWVDLREEKELCK